MTSDKTAAISANLARGMKVERAKKGWSQEDLAEKSGVNMNSISRYEMEKNIPGLNALVAMADALDCSLDDLAGRATSTNVSAA